MRVGREGNRVLSFLRALNFALRATIFVSVLFAAGFLPAITAPSFPAVALGFLPPLITGHLAISAFIAGSMVMALLAWPTLFGKPVQAAGIIETPTSVTTHPTANAQHRSGPVRYCVDCAYCRIGISEPGKDGPPRSNASYGGYANDGLLKALSENLAYWDELAVAPRDAYFSCVERRRGGEERSVDIDRSLPATKNEDRVAQKSPPECAAGYFVSGPGPRREISERLRVAIEQMAERSSRASRFHTLSDELEQFRKEYLSQQSKADEAGWKTHPMPDTERQAWLKWNREWLQNIEEGYPAELIALAPREWYQGIGTKQMAHDAASRILNEVGLGMDI